jgi:hypothetical protein
LAASKAIIITNILIRYFIIYIMDYIGAKTQTKKATETTTGIFVG